ncbi:EAL domain-containing protein [Paraburkholderia caribensis]|uniref:EAL domain-containing protein n=1 Tax=Paraburkholderia caribensis TaxID=75105 RepID=A0A9Q6S605_9BURK|nr:EAL domain-containing protein [Paraburkholderia caribensis]MCO4881592.1 EAL domain-containing protein [Paraburkholderia caribensis]PTB23008.1 GGDEF-domain containing protein [Paraburkholderia caribensis]QLB65440.1 histidine kinase [Paraburkholderia caribensis]
MIRPQDLASFRIIPAVTAALSRSQFDAFSRQLPLLYVILVINSVAVAATHVAVAPAWLAIWVPLAMCTACAIRLVVWVRRRKYLASLTDEQVASRLKTTVWLIALLGVIFTGWGLLLFPYGDPYARAHVAFYMSITVIGCIFCLMHMRKAALLLTAIVIVPFSLFFSLTHNAVLVAIAINMLLVAVAMIFILITYYRDFANLVESKHALQAKQAELQRLSDENSRLANLDLLTGLPNRRRFLADLDALFQTAQDGHARFAVGVIDLDGFKQVNDLYGHGAGDRVLEEVGRRLLDVSGPRIRLARLGGDEFGLLVTDVREAQELRDIGAAICEMLRAPYAWPGATARLSGSLGFAVYPDAGLSPAQLFERADYALYFAKEYRRGCTTIFSSEHERQIRELGQVEQALRHADLEREMTLHFQPIVDTLHERVVSYEALARWRSPALGDVPPSLFIKVAERSDFIHTVTAALLRKVLATMRTCDPAVRVAFNLSARDIGSADAVANIAGMIRESGIAPERLTFEVTETAVIQDFEQASAALDAFKQLGVHISLDDFGTGYSSLTCIHRLPLDKVKIDRGFLDRIDSDPAARDIVRSILELCRSLELTCVAEGVQTEAQADALRGLGCTVMQGFFFGAPAPFEEQSLVV